MCALGITLLPHPEMDICVVCGHPTELKSYAPRTPVCFGCAVSYSEKGWGEQKERDKPSRHWATVGRSFEPS